MSNALNIQYPSLARVRQAGANIVGAEQQNRLRAMQLKQMPEDIEYQRKVRERAVSKWVFEDEKDALDYMKKSAPLITLDQYPAAVEHFTELGANPEIFPPVETFEGNPEKFEAWKLQALSTADARLKASQPKKTKWSATKAGLDESGKQVFFQTNEQGDTRIVSGVKPEPKKGMKIYDREGNLLVDMSAGPGGGGALSKTTQGKIEQKVIDTSERASRLRSIAGAYESRFQQVGTRWTALKTGWKAKLKDVLPGTLTKISPEDRKLLDDYKTFKREAIENLNLYIKEITGAQMSEAEADRLTQAMPNPGKGLLDGDDPISFEAKLKGALRQANLANIRYAMLLKKGLDPAAIHALAKADIMPMTTVDVEGQMKQREQQIKTANPEITNDQLKDMLMSEFGISK